MTSEGARILGRAGAIAPVHAAVQTLEEELIRVHAIAGLGGPGIKYVWVEEVDRKRDRFRADGILQRGQPGPVRSLVYALENTVVSCCRVESARASRLGRKRS